MVNCAAALEFTQPVNRADALDHPQAHAHAYVHAHPGNLDRLHAHTDNLDHTRAHRFDVTRPHAHTHNGTHSLDLDLDPYLDLANLINDQADRTTDKNTAGSNLPKRA
jgi:hypothetical protein